MHNCHYFGLQKIPRRCLSMMFVIIPWFSACRTLWSCWTGQSGKPRTLSQGRSQGSPEQCFKKILFDRFLLFDYFSLFDCSMLFCYFSLFDCSLTSSHSAWSSLPLVLNSMPPQLMTPSKDLFLVFQQGHPRPMIDFYGCIYQQSACNSRTSPARWIRAHWRRPPCTQALRCRR